MNHEKTSQIFESDEGWAVEFLGGPMNGTIYREGRHALFFDSEFLGVKSPGLLVHWRPIANWDPPMQSTVIHASQAEEIVQRVIVGLRNLGHDAAYEHKGPPR
jgi:hypothetical protein